MGRPLGRLPWACFLDRDSITGEHFFRKVRALAVKRLRFPPAKAFFFTATRSYRQRFAQTVAPSIEFSLVSAIFTPKPAATRRPEAL
jgi:hypothetical protein